MLNKTASNLARNRRQSYAGHSFSFQNVSPAWRRSELVSGASPGQTSVKLTDFAPGRGFVSLRRTLSTALAAPPLHRVQNFSFCLTCGWPILSECHNHRPGQYTVELSEHLLFKVRLWWASRPDVHSSARLDTCNIQYARCVDAYMRHAACVFYSDVILRRLQINTEISFGFLSRRRDIFWLGRYVHHDALPSQTRALTHCS